MREIIFLLVVSTFGFVVNGCMTKPTHGCEILGGDKYNGFDIRCPEEYRQDPLEHQDFEYRNTCPDPLSEECVLVA